MLGGKICCIFVDRDTDLSFASWHRGQPRRIIPGQKVHASVLYANAYRPSATRGEGFEVPIVRSEVEELDDRLWETGLFDDTAAQELVTYLGNPQGVAPIYLDRLLFMLRFSKFYYVFHPLGNDTTLAFRGGKTMPQEGT